jgi:hypothetical protein
MRIKSPSKTTEITFSLNNLQTNQNDTKPNKFNTNQKDYKFIETINNNDRQVTNKANLNTLVQVTKEDQMKLRVNNTFNQSM